jgi:hypothetical protein
MPGVLSVSLPRLRAPVADGAVLAQPPLADVGSVLESNRQLLNRESVQIGGIPLAELRKSAVAEIASTAADYLAENGEPVPERTADSLLMAGHQPEMFHPGVWLKNFALHSLGRRQRVTPLNLVVDNDTVKSTTIRAPQISDRDNPASVHLVTLPFDHFAGEVAYEERAVQDELMFAHFPGAVVERTRNWPFAPVLSTFWSDVVSCRSPLIGERFAAARRKFERSWGCHNLELPISRMCRTAAFARFATGILAELPKFHTTYNDCVHDYRRRHRIRSANHPVPDLQRDGEWLETPFWAWRAGEERRARLFARSTPGGWRLRAGENEWPDLPASGSANRWQRLESDGFKIRTRALTTTLFARLCLADLFVHGIGGGKYDELTDAIIAKHFGLPPPAFLILTGTLRLPLPGYPATDEDERAAWRLVRDIHWNPQRHLPPDAEDWHDMVEARRLVTVQNDTTWRKQRFKELRRLNDRIRTRVADIEETAHRRARHISAEVAANAILRRRDYSFCLFPESSLRPFLTQTIS